MKKTTIGSVIAVMISMSVMLPSHAMEQETPASLLAAVNTSDGVSKIEAENIAKAYFLLHVGCGAFDHISEAEDDWVVERGFGYAGLPIKGFFIGKQSGTITSPVGPSYVHPQDMLK